MTSQPEGQDFQSGADLPKPERGTTETDVHVVQQLPSENIPNVAALTDGADAGSGGLSGDNGQQQGQQQVQETAVVAEDDEKDSSAK